MKAPESSEVWGTPENPNKEGQERVIKEILGETEELSEEVISEEMSDDVLNDESLEIEDTSPPDANTVKKVIDRIKKI